MSQLRLSIVIPCFDHSYVLRRTLKSLQNQTLQPDEIVIVDDGSRDGDEVGRIVDDVELNLSIRLIRSDENRGAPWARNYGARETSGTYLLFLDADAELRPDALASFVRALDEHPDVDFVYADFLWGAKRFHLEPFSIESLKRRNYIHTSSLLRRSAFPGFDESFKKFQDWDLWLTMVERGSKGYWIDRVLYRIEPRRTGMSHWLPRCAYRIPWKWFGFIPKEVMKYRIAEEIVRKKHGI